MPDYVLSVVMNIVKKKYDCKFVDYVKDNWKPVLRGIQRSRLKAFVKILDISNVNVLEALRKHEQEKLWSDDNNRNLLVYFNDFWETNSKKYILGVKMAIKEVISEFENGY